MLVGGGQTTLNGFSLVPCPTRVLRVVIIVTTSSNLVLLLI